MLAHDVASKPQVLSLEEPNGLPEAALGVVIFCSLVLAFAQQEKFLERNAFCIRAINILRKLASLWSPPQPGPWHPPPLSELLKGRFLKIPHFLRE